MKKLIHIIKINSIKIFSYSKLIVSAGDLISSLLKEDNITSETLEKLLSFLESFTEVFTDKK